MFNMPISIPSKQRYVPPLLRTIAQCVTGTNRENGVTFDQLAETTRLRADDCLYELYPRLIPQTSSDTNTPISAHNVVRVSHESLNFFTAKLAGTANAVARNRSGPALRLNRYFALHRFIRTSRSHRARFKPADLYYTSSGKVPTVQQLLWYLFL